MTIQINGQAIGPEEPVFFIADIAANHGGELSKAKELIQACAESGVDAVKMQNFSAASIVSDVGFRSLDDVSTHQSSWTESVFDSYDAASIPLDWTQELRGLCTDLGLAYFTSPYSLELVEELAPHLSAFKAGSGEITWLEELRAMARHSIPLLIATGASTLAEVEAAMDAALALTSDVLLMQCNTEYTASVDESDEERNQRFAHINLRVLETYGRQWPDTPLGLSDHTHGAMTVLGAVGLFNCCAVEKHFTLDNTEYGQDHRFSMTPKTWSEMVDQTTALREDIRSKGARSYEDRLDVVRSHVDDPAALELAIGDGVKRVEANETGTVVVQRRSLRAARDLEPGTVLARSDLSPLRPCPPDAISPARIDVVVGATVKEHVAAGEYLRAADLEGGW